MILYLQIFPLFFVSHIDYTSNPNLHPYSPLPSLTFITSGRIRGSPYTVSPIRDGALFEGCNERLV